MRKTFAALFLLVAAFLTARETALFPILKSTIPLGKQPEGFYLVPTNQLLRPWGTQLEIPGRPVELAFDSHKSVLAILNTRSIVLADGLTGTKQGEIKTSNTSYTGLTFRPGDRELWASLTKRNGPDGILVVPMSETGQPDAEVTIPLEGHPLPSGIAFSSDGNLAYVAFSRNNSVGVFDARERKLLKEIPAGIAPFDVAAIGSDRILVTNRGGRRPHAGETTAPSAGSDVITDPETGSTTTGTVTLIEKDGSTKEIEVGLAPSKIAVSAKIAAVMNSHSDSVSMLDLATMARTDVNVPVWPGRGPGSIPTSAVFSPDGKRLYVTCGGTNAVAVLTQREGKWQAAGAVPSGYFPTAIQIDKEGALKVLNLKGYANTANKKGTFNSREYIGTLSQIPEVTAAQLDAATREVIASNNPQFEPAGGVAKPSTLGIEHVLFIIKENRTYDQVFGDIPRGNGDPKLVFYGRNVTPNHHALAEKYVLLDNFYSGGAISFDGHQWLMQAFVSDYVERAFASSPRGYAWNMSDALVVAKSGFFWQGTKKPMDLRIYGEFCLPALWDPGKKSAVDIDEKAELSWAEYWAAYKNGQWHDKVGSRSGVPALQRYVNPRSPHNSTAIPDQIRVEAFLQEFGEYEKNGKWPQLVILTLNNDHTNGTRPGSPTPRAMVADNDLALGRVVEAVSKSKFWEKTLILVVEDDAQDGLDHVDGHRTVALAIGPNVRRAVTDSNNYNHTSMVRTIQEIIGVQPRTRFAQAARVMSSVFTTEKDLSAYKSLVPQVAPDEMNPPAKALNGRRRWAAEESARMNWKEVDDVPQETLNRILWWDAKGYDKEYPGK